MASTSVSRIVPASPEHVWRLIGGFDSLPDWLPFIPSSTLEDGGRMRRLSDAEGQTIVERLISFDEEQRFYSYSIVEAPFPVTDYLSTLRVYAVTGDDAVSEVQWSGRFTPRDVPDADVVALFTGIYSDGLEALRKALG
ncbi:SRPBCC family protein [Streptomyces sp. NBC_00820]|uniref:SRPBCC family protein n=1 Tax=Streptomyces sp. NBC_00820 TaxID=2975842 RepID=UPI002ECFD7DE|nr:SRPBCC family protein [Streptomyces sp. NBC_00820]